MPIFAMKSVMHIWTLLLLSVKELNYRWKNNLCLETMADSVRLWYSKIGVKTASIEFLSQSFYNTSKITLIEKYLTAMIRKGNGNKIICHR